MKQKRNPDLVDRIIEYVSKLPNAVHSDPQSLELVLRREFGGQHEAYVRSAAEMQQRLRVRDVMMLFNGRNATEVARKLQISRATVYRIIKQPGTSRLSQDTPNT